MAFKVRKQWLHRTALRIAILEFEVDRRLFFQFVALFATLALANAGFIAEQPAYTSYVQAPAVKTLVQPIAYAAHPQASSSQSITRTVSQQPKAYIAQPAVSSYSYEPQHQYAVPQQHYAVSSYQQPQQVYAAAPAYGHYSHGSSEQTVRSAHGTVSQFSKAVDTPYSSVRKSDTRIVNDGYKTLSYAQPAAYAVQQPAAYAVHQPATYAVQQPAVHTTYAVQQPAVHSYSAPVVAKTVISQPIQQYAAAPAHYQYAAQPQQYQTYAQHAPVLASKVHYSPAIEVAHASFESPVAHYSW